MKTIYLRQQEQYSPWTQRSVVLLSLIFTLIVSALLTANVWGLTSDQASDITGTLTVNNGDLIVKGDGTLNTGRVKIMRSFTDNGDGHFSFLQDKNGIVLVNNTSWTDTYTHFKFQVNGVDVGFISTMNKSTLFLSTSDYRLKKDLQPVENASERLMQLNPVNFAWKDDGSRSDGFLAHEVQEVVPQAVSGKKDAMTTEEYEVSPAAEATFDEDGNELTLAVEAVMGVREVEDYQVMDHSKLVPLLTAALQEVLQRVEVLEARIALLNSVALTDSNRDIATPALDNVNK